jgi:hypothetical protein
VRPRRPPSMRSVPRGSASNARPDCIRPASLAAPARSCRGASRASRGRHEHLATLGVTNGPLWRPGLLAAVGPCRQGCR